MNDVFLIDSVKNFDSLDISKLSESIVISLDYFTHKELEKRSISHEISDPYLSSQELQMIQNSSYNFSKWFENDNFSSYLEYSGVNIGNLACSELYVFLLPFLKKFFEIKKICQKYNGSIFHVSSELQKITKEFSNTIEEDLKSDKTELLFDNFVLDNIFFKIKLSKKNFDKLKSFSDQIIKNFFSAKTESDFDVLLVEFNTNLYENLFKSLNNSGLKTLFYGLKRPAVWDKNSFSVMKQSKSKIAIYSDFVTNNVQSNSKYHTQKLLENLDDLLQNNELEKFFSLFDTTFWVPLKFIFEKLCKKYIDNLVIDIEATRNILQKYRPKTILLLSESSKTDQIVISQAKILGIPFYLLQHGLGYDTLEGHSWNEFTGSLPNNSLKFFVWGNAMLNYSKTYGIPFSKVDVVGSVAHDPIFSTDLQNLKNDYILLAIEGPSHTDIRDYTVKIHDEYEHVLKIIFDTVHNANKKLLVKFHPHENNLNKTSIEHLLNPSVKIIKQGLMPSFLSNCELLITMSITTAILDAYILKKPVLRVAFREWMGKSDKCRKSSSPVIHIQDFESVFNKILNDKEFREEVISNGKEFVDDCLSFPAVSADKLSNTLKNILKS